MRHGVADCPLLAASVPPFGATATTSCCRTFYAERIKIMNRTNAGYEIINSFSVGTNEIVLGKKPDSKVPYVTWYCRAGTDYFWGNYFEKESDALRDFCERSLSEVNIFYPTVQTISADNPSDTVIKRIINGAECYLSLSKDEVTEICSKQAIKDTISDIEYRISESDTFAELNVLYPLTEKELTAIADDYLYKYSDENALYALDDYIKEEFDRKQVAAEQETEDECEPEM